ncbi:hypothetical protein STXM2123_4002 [Streptomyces sp. F-3]|nr:hypothetical protein STXM2123_4002 [Streptomyces sp. F-3]
MSRRHASHTRCGEHRTAEQRGPHYCADNTRPPVLGRHCEQAGSSDPDVRAGRASRDRHSYDCGQARGSAAPHPAGHARRLAAGGGKTARQGQADRAGTHRAAAGRRLLRGTGRVRPAPLEQLRPGPHPPLRRRRGHRLRHRRRPPGGGVLPGLHRLRRRPGRGLRPEDRQGDGLRPENRLPRHRHQRLRRRPHPRRRRLPGRLRRDLPPQHPRLRRHPPDQPDHGPLRRRRGVLPRHHRLHRHGRPDLAHVHHRPRRDQNRHRRGRGL